MNADQSKIYLQDILKFNKKYLRAIGWETLTVDNTAGGKSLASIPTEANYALIVVESSISTPAIRYLECGNTVTVVTSSVGIPKSNLDGFDVVGRENLLSFRAIQVGAGTHTLSIQYYK